MQQTDFLKNIGAKHYKQNVWGGIWTGNLCYPF